MVYATGLTQRITAVFLHSCQMKLFLLYTYLFHTDECGKASRYMFKQTRYENASRIKCILIRSNLLLSLFASSESGAL